MEIANEKLNELVARKLGWMYCNRFDAGWHRGPNEPCGDILSSFHHNPLPDYCHSIEAAFEIVEYLRNALMGFTLRRGASGWDVVMESYKPEHIVVRQEADTAPMAICKAFLKLP